MIIYKTTNLINGKIYVGQTHQNRESYLGSGKLLLSAIKKYGKENFSRETLCECSDIEELNDKEKYYIAKFDATNKNIGYNIKAGGQQFLHNDQSKNKLRLAHIGKIFTNQHKLNLKKSRNSRPPMSEEYKIKRKQGKRTIFSESTIQKMRKSKIAYNKITQFDSRMNILSVFDSIHEATIRSGIPESSIRNVCSGIRNSVHGFVFKWEKI